MKKAEEIKLGFCVAYDWEYLRVSLPLVYEHADRICLSLDKDRISWSGQKFVFDEGAFYGFVREVDIKSKIDIYEDDFHLAELKPMENEVRQRNKIADRLGSGGWHVQLDSDEYFLDFRGFTDYLRSFRSTRQVNINCLWHTMYKRVEHGYLFIKEASSEQFEFISVATRYPHYEFGRRNGYFNIKTPFVILHQSWARSEEEIFQKISNWGHKEDFDVQTYFEKWKQLNETNCEDFRNFHPINPGNWNALEFVKAGNVQSLIETLRAHPPFQLDLKQLARGNALWRSRIRHILQKIRG